MPRYYFHLEDGQCLLDENGLDLPDIVAAQDEVLRTSGNQRGRGEARCLEWGSLTIVGD